jgi:hypothetical protein
MPISGISLESFQQAAVKYRKELLMLPIIGLESTLQFMTPRPGIQYKEAVGTISGDVGFAPYNRANKTDFDPDVNVRELETFFGSCVLNFEPNKWISTILGANAANSKGDGQINAPMAKDVLFHIAKALSQSLNDAIFSAKRDAKGTTTSTLFNGFDTIIKNEKTSLSDNSVEKSFATDFAPDVCGDTFKSILKSMSPKLRAQNSYVFCSQNILDNYNEWYLLTHGAAPYYNQYNQIFVEGSNNKMMFVPLSNKSDDVIQITTKDNMLVGFDQMGDIENVMVKEYEPFLLTYVATMFFGVQYESIHKDRLHVIFNK